MHTSDITFITAHFTPLPRTTSPTPHPPPPALKSMETEKDLDVIQCFGCLQSLKPCKSRRRPKKEQKPVAKSQAQISTLRKTIYPKFTSATARSYFKESYFLAFKNVVIKKCAALFTGLNAMTLFLPVGLTISRV